MSYAKQSQLKIKKLRSIIPAFTLVELIVVIVILAILATIAFLSFNSYSSSSRDSVRLADIANLNKGIELYNVKSGYYPNPDGVISSGTVNGVSVVYKGIIGDNISKLANINKTPVDPLSSSNYVYGISYDKKYFQIGVVLENSSNKTSYDSNGVENVLAGSGTGDFYSRIKGNYGGYIKFSSGTTVKSYYIANIPSLLYNNNGSVDLLSTGTYFVVDNNTNLPYSVSPNITTNNKTADTIIKEVTNKPTATLTGVDITSIINFTGTTTQKTALINSTFSGVTLDSFGGDVGLVSSVVNIGVSSSSNINSLSCSGITQSGYTISSLSSGQNQTFYKSITNGTGSLTVSCNNGTFNYGTENIVCNSGYHTFNGMCISGPVLISTGFGTIIGNMTTVGGLAEAFNGTYAGGNYWTSAGVAVTNGWTGVGYIGKDWGAGNSKIITRFKAYSSTSGFDCASQGATITVVLQGSNDNSSWNDLATTAVSDSWSSQTVVDIPTASINTSAAYRYHRLKITGTFDSGGQQFQVCEVEFYEGQ